LRKLWYRKPSAKAAAAAGIDLQGTVECPYFTDQETQELVALYGGDAASWGPLAFAAGAAAAMAVASAAKTTFDAALAALAKI
jgi:hypothetical protein